MKEMPKPAWRKKAIVWKTFFLVMISLKKLQGVSQWSLHKNKKSMHGSMIWVEDFENVFLKKGKSIETSFGIAEMKSVIKGH